MNTLALPDTEAADTTGWTARVEQLERFADQASEAIGQLVESVLEVQQRAAPPELATLAAEVRELKQQFALDRAQRDLAHTSRMHPKARRMVFVGTTYFGCNVKYAWLEALRQASARALDVWFLPFNAQQAELVASLGGQCLPVAPADWSAEHLHVALSAAVVVTTDHFLNPNPYASALLAGARHVQLWHGVSIKEIGLRNLPGGRALGPHLARVLATCGPYATLVGTAGHAEPEWRRWFAFERYAALGYARNDVLHREPTPGDLAGCDAAAYRRACEALAKGRRVVLYAPTFRDGCPEWVLQAGIEHLAQATAQRGDLLMVNLHPVESPQIGKLQPLMPGVVFVQPRTDCYPLLAKASALVTDYSSVMFDYLHVDRPVLFYRPDHERYVTQSRKLFDDKLGALPGPLFERHEGLAKALRREDLGQTPAHAALRSALRARWFDHHDGASAERLLDALQDEVARAGAPAPAPAPAPAHAPAPAQAPAHGGQP